MSIPLIHKPEDRCPYPDGTKVVYWHYSDDGPSAHAHPDGTLYQGIVETIKEAKRLPLTWVEAKPGDRVIQVLTTDGKPSGAYDPFMLAPVAPNEPQRWFAEGVDPRTL